MLPILLETLILSSSCFHNLKKTTKKITADTQTTTGQNQTPHFPSASYAANRFLTHTLPFYTCSGRVKEIS